MPEASTVATVTMENEYWAILTQRSPFILFILELCACFSFYILHFPQPPILQMYLRYTVYFFLLSGPDVISKQYVTTEGITFAHIPQCASLTNDIKLHCWAVHWEPSYGLFVIQIIFFVSWNKGCTELFH